ncbi:MAG: cysteine desulfurase family protein [Candidatus Melainabacteria bacterium]|nr:cysteine desulfurase family protein [Candidatus Melainabacteria bacterium]
MNKIYFDNSATTPLATEVIEVLIDSFKNSFANPSSIHGLGKSAKKKIEEARTFIANTINAKSHEIFFLSGATEANNTAFKTCSYDLIITSPSEHASVIEPAKASRQEIIWLDLDQEGYISLNELENILAKNSNAGNGVGEQCPKKILVSIMHANSEIGTVQNLKAIGDLCEKYKATFHSDCVQSLGKLDIDVKNYKLDLISASAHKLHGPKGLGFIYIAEKLQDHILDKALITGGGQEQGFRAGTENVNAIIAFAKALEISLDPEKRNKVKELQKKLWMKLKNLKSVVLNGPQDLEKRLSGNLNLSFMDLKFNSEQLVLQLDLRGICVSSGSACTSNKKNTAEIIESSYVLRACQIDEDIARRAIRISLSWMNDEAELEKLTEIITKLV